MVDDTGEQSDQMGNNSHASAHQTPTSLQLTQVDPGAPIKDPEVHRLVNTGVMRQPNFSVPNGGKKRRGKKSRKSRKGRKPRKGKKSRKNKRRTKRR